MMPALICVVSFVAFVQLLAAYCRSILASSRRVELSDRVRDVAGFASNRIGAGDFGRLLQLVHLCPERGDDHGDIRAVGTYYRILGALQWVTGSMVPRIASWASRERENCSYFAAVALDRRISHTRDLFIEEMGGSRA